jgi:formylglycine-generating enzyme required for sulfatase activity
MNTGKTPSISDFYIIRFVRFAMRKRAWHVLFPILIINLCLTDAAFPKEQLAVMDLKVEYGVKKGLAEALSVEIRNEIHRHSEYEVLSKEDLETIADRAAVRQSLGCDDTQCLINFGRAIGTKYMVAGSISKLGDTYSIHLGLVNTKGDDAGVKSRKSTKCRCSEDELFDSARTVAAMVMGKKGPQVSSSVKTSAISKETVMGRLFVGTEPENSRVRILNIVPKFYQGIELEPDRYHVEVSASGHETEKQWLELGAGEDKYIDIRLEKIRVAETIAPSGKSFTNSIGMKFMLLRAGTFMMGSPSNEPGRDNDERQHRVTISKPFYMQTTEVTQGQWREVMRNNPSHFKNCGDDCPVEEVSWNDVQQFVRKLNQREGANKYRLPTEAEWEYACRAGNTTKFCFGDSDGQLGEYAWYNSNSSWETHSVGQKKPNAWGFYDMHGNVWEWCQDWKGDYPSGHVTDPTGLSSGSYRVDRGGSWGSYAGGCRSADRSSYDPGGRFGSLGFRLARTL